MQYWGMTLNSLVYHRNIFGSSSEVFGNLRTSSEIFGKCSGTFVWYSEQFWWSEIFGKSSKTPSSACLYNKKNITRRLEDMNKQKTSLQSYKTQIKVLLFLNQLNRALNNPGQGATLLGWPKSIYQIILMYFGGIAFARGVTRRPRKEFSFTEYAH